ncbi:APC family permease [Gordonia sp. TBRC 11910]|uniref:APC family permease n=1 Tax=Gordonia asplenii TaxID=2725283 RepID=A0A848KRE6_9ACTN|nr:APC family permease [Gordonia asplenii]NMO00649.1 APC family permease [Gordonia asplenii]
MTSTESVTAQTAATPDDAHLEGGHLSQTALVSLSLSTFMPALGMALLPMLMVSAAGPSAVFSTVLTAVLMSCVGVAVITFARRYVAAGSIYSYVGEVFGPWARLLSAGALLTGYAIQIAAISSCVGLFVGSFFASHGVTGTAGLLVQAGSAVAAIVIATVVAYRGADTSVRAAVGLALVSIPLVALIVGASALHTHLNLGGQFHLASGQVSGILLGVATGAAWLIGFESCTAMATETKDPHRAVPLAVMAGPIVLGVLYVVCTIAEVPGLIATQDRLAAGESAPAALAINAGLGATIASATDVVLAVAAFAGLIGMINYASRCTMAIADDALLPATFTKIHERYHSPSRAIVIMAALGAALILTLTLATGSLIVAYTLLATLMTLVWVVPYVLVCLGAIALNRRLGQRKPLVALACVVGILGIGWVAFTVVLSPAAVAIAIAPAIVALGTVFCVVTRRRRRATATPTAVPA